MTPREQQVAVLAARGRSLEDIAHELGIAPSTVGTHLAIARRAPWTGPGEHLEEMTMDSNDARRIGSAARNGVLRSLQG